MAVLAGDTQTENTPHTHTHTTLLQHPALCRIANQHIFITKTHSKPTLSVVFLQFTTDDDNNVRPVEEGGKKKKRSVTVGLISSPRCVLLRKSPVQTSGVFVREPDPRSAHFPIHYLLSPYQ